MAGKDQVASFNTSEISPPRIINLDKSKPSIAKMKSEPLIVEINGSDAHTRTAHQHPSGDPTMFEAYWRKMDEKCSLVISGNQFLSYFSDTKNVCWYLEPKLEDEIKRLHRVVGNASVEDYYVVVGTGSTQLLQAALYALCPSDGSNPVNVVSAVPYYSCYPELTGFLRSSLYEWKGDARIYDEGGPYIEFVTSPNNPDGSIREAIVKNGQGKLVHDLAYYWPQYTPITSCVGHEIMLFTLSKCTGHAGTRIGWALVKDKDVAKKMTEFNTISTIGVSKESQIRAAKILGLVSDSCLNPGPDNFFKHGKALMAERWEKLRKMVGQSGLFSLPQYPKGHCFFTGEFSTEAHPAFAWIKCNKEDIGDCEKFLRGFQILTRTGRRFGCDAKYVRISLVGKEEEFELFLEKLLAIQEDF